MRAGLETNELRFSAVTESQAAHAAKEAAKEALAAADNANKAAEGVQDAIDRANVASSNAESAAKSANDAASSAKESATKADEAAESANAAASSANDSANTATDAATEATAAATAATSAANSANTAASNANDAASKATESAQKADDSSAKAEQSATEADAATGRANAAAAAAETAAHAITGNILKGTLGPAEVLTADDTYPQTPLGLKVFGSTRQNLWVNPNGTNNGITVTSNEDGTITVSGTSTRNSTVVSGNVYSLKPGGAYTLSIDEETDFDTYGFYVQSYDGSSYKTLGRVFGSTKSTAITIPEDSVRCRFGVQVMVTTEISGTYRVMLNEGSEAEPWCPPGIHSVGELMAHERNLWVNPSGTQNGVTTKINDDGSVILSGTTTKDSGNWVAPAKKVFILKPNTKYAISLDGTKDEIKTNIIYAGKTKHSFGAGAYTFTTEDDVSDCSFVLASSVPLGTEVSGTYRVMLNEGSTAQPWVPPGVESAVEVVTAGKNLLETWNQGNGAVLNANRIFSRVNLLPGKYVFTASNGYYAYAYRNSKSGNYFGNSEVEVRHIEISEKGTYDFVVTKQGWADLTPDEATVAKAQLEFGSTATAYEPPNVTTTTIDLQGNELCSLPDGTRDVLDVVTGEIEKEVGYIASYDGEEVGENYVSSSLTETGEIANEAQVVYELSEPQTIQLTPSELPALPAPNLTAYADSDVACDMEIEYARDVNIAYIKLEQAITATAANI